MRTGTAKPGTTAALQGNVLTSPSEFDGALTGPNHSQSSTFLCQAGFGTSERRQNKAGSAQSWRTMITW